MTPYLRFPAWGRLRAAQAGALLVALALLLLCGAASHAQEDPAVAPQAVHSTVINQNITTNTTWSLAGSPYVVQGFYIIQEGVTLTIEAGVEVQFVQHAGLRARGTLTAVGSEAQPILFTGTEKAKGWWQGLRVEGSGTALNTGSTFDHVTIEYAGSAYGNLYLYYATVPVTHSVIRESARDGIYADSRGLVNVSYSTFTNNGNGAVGFFYAIRLTDGSMNPVFAGVTATGNVIDAIALGGGTLAGEHIWENVGLPYVVLSPQVVAENATLTIEPGISVRFARHAALTVYGTLTAVGSESQPILFTGTSAEKGWWQGIRIQGSGGALNTGSAFSHVTIEYAGSAYGNLYVYYAQVPVTHSVIRESARDGIYADSRGLVNVSYSTFTNNGNGAVGFFYAIRLTDGSMNPVFAGVTATGNVIDAIALGGGTLAGEHIWENVGLPYVVLSPQVVAENATLTIEPGISVRFARHAALTVYGTLAAVGSESQPILFTGTSAEKGWWQGIRVQGTGSRLNQGTAFEHAIIEYAGSAYGNLYLYYAQVTVAHSTIRESARDGVYADAGAGSTTIEASHILSNQQHGVRNAAGNVALMASNNWWGHPSGPVVADSPECNAGATGSVVSTNVDFRPFLRAGDEPINPVAAPASYTMTIAPQRWFIPADGVTRGEVIITLRDGEGNPVPGKAVTLHTTHGSAQSGGLTDARGEARARIFASNEGEAQLTASIRIDDVCATQARSGMAVVTFTEFRPGDLMPDAAAPYLNDGLEFNPEPIVKDVPTVITARIVNPNNFPISVNGTFGIAQSGIGLSFPPVGSVENHIVPANSTGVISVTWVPPISGHYCVVFEFSWTGTGSAEAAAVQGRQRTQRNLNVYGGTPNSYTDKDILNKASKAGTYIGGLGNGTGEGFIPGVGATILTEWQLTMGARISRALGGDPPRQDYTVIAIAEPELLPPVPAGGSVTPDMAAALNDLRTEMAWANAHGNAAIISFDRYGGASAANELIWASQQINTMNLHKHEMAKRLLEVADALDAYRAARQAAGIPDASVSADDLRAYQQRLATTGFTEEEIAAARAVGMTDAEIEEVRQQHIEADPDEQAGGFMDTLTAMAADYRRLANQILYPPTFGMGAVGGRPGAATVPDAFIPVGAIEPPPPVSKTNNLARVFDVVNTIQIGNPTGETATIDLRVRPVNLPSGWMATVTPISVTLPAGAQVPVEVRITPSGPSVQGTTPRVAVEGYLGETLLGGVTMDVIVPVNVLKEKPVYLPVIARP